jgi:hypothetical protein
MYGSFDLGKKKSFSNTLNEPLPLPIRILDALPFMKNGNKIHIKKKNRGKFTSYCGGKVTDSCIRRAKASGNPTLVKRATFAANARKWKH